MNNLVKFCEWAKENGYDKVKIPSNLMRIFTEYLDHESDVNKLNKNEAIKSFCSCGAEHSVEAKYQGQCNYCLKQIP